MKPIFSVSANGNDITGILAERLMSLRITDVAGFKSDTATFTLDNRDLKLGVPSSNAELDIRLGYEKENSWITGKYLVDEIRLTGRPKTLVIGAKATDMRNKLKAPRSQSWHQVTIGEIVAKIAERNEYVPKVSEPLASTFIDHIDQTEESDMHFLTRLAQLYGAVFKPANGFLIFAPRHQLLSATGKTLPLLTVKEEECIGRWEYISTERGRYQSVIARYRDTEANSDVEVRVGNEEPVYTLRTSYSCAEEALAAAHSKKDAMDRGVATLTIPALGKPAAKAERPLLTEGFHHLVDDTSWVVETVVHVFDGSGLRTNIDAEIKK